MRNVVRKMGRVSQELKLKNEIVKWSEACSEEIKKYGKATDTTWKNLSEAENSLKKFKKN